MLEAIGRKSENGSQARMLHWGGSAAVTLFVAGPVLPALGVSADVTLGVLLALGSTATVLLARGMRRTLRPRWR